jgi:hypothetical protein
VLEQVKADVIAKLVELGLSESSLDLACQFAEVAISKGLADARDVLGIVHFVRGHYPHLFGASGGSLITQVEGLTRTNPRDIGKPTLPKTTTTLPIAKGDNRIVKETPPVVPPKPALGAIADTSDQKDE